MSKERTQINHLAEIGFRLSNLRQKHNFISRHDWRSRKGKVTGVKAIISAKSQGSLLDNYPH
jgi:hypothetical protein